MHSSFYNHCDQRVSFCPGAGFAARANLLFATPLMRVAWGIAISQETSNVLGVSYLCASDGLFFPGVVSVRHHSKGGDVKTRQRMQAILQTDKILFPVLHSPPNLRVKL
jgi:hypothetical protein